MVWTVDGLVIRESSVGDHDKLITLLTADKGQIRVMAKGARSPRSKIGAATQLFSYGNYELYAKGELNWVRGASLNESFYGLRTRVDALFLASYLCEVACEITGEGVPAEEVLRMTLNSLYAIAKQIKPPEQIKAVYELRAAGLSGYMPDLHGCERCAEVHPAFSYLDVMNGALICRDCLIRRPVTVDELAADSVNEHGERTLLLPMSHSVLSAVRYVLSAPSAKMFSFALKSEEDMADFARVGEDYLLNHLEKGFHSIELFKSVR